MSEPALSTRRTTKGPPAWLAVDAEVQAALDRARDLHERARTASAEARTASEAVAEAEHADQRRRSMVLADGGEDPGRDEAKILRAEKAAEAAAERAGVLAEAATEAERRFQRVCEERAEPWGRAAREALRDADEALLEVS